MTNRYSTKLAHSMTAKIEWPGVFTPLVVADKP